MNNLAVDDIESQGHRFGLGDKWRKSVTESSCYHTNSVVAGGPEQALFVIFSYAFRNNAMLKIIRAMDVCCELSDLRC